MTSSHVVDVAILGGGLCGVLAGQRCAIQGIKYRIIERGDDFGGVWSTLANDHSHLQVRMVKILSKLKFRKAPVRPRPGH